RVLAREVRHTAGSAPRDLLRGWFPAPDDPRTAGSTLPQTWNSSTLHDFSRSDVRPGAHGGGGRAFRALHPDHRRPDALRGLRLGLVAGLRGAALHRSGLADLGGATGGEARAPDSRATRHSHESALEPAADRCPDNVDRDISSSLGDRGCPRQPREIL